MGDAGEVKMGGGLAPVHAEKYAAKFVEMGGGEPTDDALGDAFKGCVRPARPKEYDSIREALRQMLQDWDAATDGQREEALRDAARGAAHE